MIWNTDFESMDPGDVAAPGEKLGRLIDVLYRRSFYAKRWTPPREPQDIQASGSFPSSLHHEGRDAGSVSVRPPGSVSTRDRRDPHLVRHHRHARRRCIHGRRHRCLGGGHGADAVCRRHGAA